MSEAVGLSVIPVWGRVWVEPDNIEETDPALARAKAFDFKIVDTRMERERMAQTEGTLVAAGGNCFEDWKGVIPSVGDKVLFDKYAGATKVVDGVTYRLINDTDILAIVKKGQDHE